MYVFCLLSTGVPWWSRWIVRWGYSRNSINDHHSGCSWDWNFLLSSEEKKGEFTFPLAYPAWPPAVYKVKLYLNYASVSLVHDSQNQNTSMHRNDYSSSSYSITHFCNALKQTWAKCGPRAICGPLAVPVRPAEVNCKLGIKRKYLYLLYGSSECSKKFCWLEWAIPTFAGL